MIEFRLDVHDPDTYNKVGEVSDFLSLEYSKLLNRVGVARFVLDGQNKGVANIRHNSVVRVMWRDVAAGSPLWREDFAGIRRSIALDEARRGIVTITCPSPLNVLSRRVVAWPAGRAGRSEFVNVALESIMRDVVRWNATAIATTANGRLSSISYPPLVVGNDLARGPIIDYRCFGQNILKVLQELQAAYKFDFDLAFFFGGRVLQFEVYPNFRGEDRRAALIFSKDRGNVAEVSYEYDQIHDANVAIVAGQGEGDLRAFTIRSRPTSSEDQSEIFVDARNAETASERESAGDASLSENGSLASYGFKIIQQERTRYGIHYNVGDVATVRVLGQTLLMKITGATVAYTPESGNRYSVDVEMEQYAD